MRVRNISTMFGRCERGRRELWAQSCVSACAGIVSVDEAPQALFLLKTDAFTKYPPAWRCSIAANARRGAANCGALRRLKKISFRESELREAQKIHLAKRARRRNIRFGPKVGHITPLRWRGNDVPARKFSAAGKHPRSDWVALVQLCERPSDRRCFRASRDHGPDRNSALRPHGRATRLKHRRPSPRRSFAEQLSDTISGNEFFSI